MNSEARLKYGPVNLGGALARMVELPDKSGRLETWGAKGWEAGGTDLPAMMTAPYASPAILREYDVPEKDWSPEALREARDDAVKNQHKG